MTADVTDAARDKCLAAGMNDYATKPIDRVRLLELMQRLLESA
jgi:CheY-like chemotaxis protein